MTPDFCPRCGAPTKTLTPDPQFCSSCGLLLRVDVEIVVGTAPDDEVEAPDEPEIPSTFDPFSHLSEGRGWSDSLAMMMDRHFAADIPLPLDVGVIIQMGVPIEASRPMHRRNFAEQLADPARRPLPYNLAVNPHLNTPAVWIDAADNLVSRAAALVYYWGSESMGRKWHFADPLDWEDSTRLVTTTGEQTLDFEILLLEDMRLEDADGELNYTRVLEAAFSKLEHLLTTGVNTKSRNIAPVGDPTGWAIFNMDEQDPKYRSAK